MVTRFWCASSQIRLIAAVIAGLALMCPLNAGATNSRSEPAYDQSDTTPNARPAATGQHVEGHIAFLRAELAIMPEQEQYWTPVVDAMREDVQAMQEAERQVSRQMYDRETAIEYLQNRAMFANLRAQGEARFLAALQPLYDHLSAQQKKVADDLLVSSNKDQ